MPVTVAKTSGFCFGVNRAISIVQDQLKAGKSVCTLGEIIHNAQIVDELREKGARPINSLNEMLPGEIAVIRSHGVQKSVYEQLDQEKIDYVDATCPYVRKIHEIVESKTSPGDIVFIAGDKFHPEVRGIVGHCTCDNRVFKDAIELEAQLEKLSGHEGLTYFFIAQTTFSLSEWEKCAKIAKKVCTNPIIFDTICNATTKQQIEAEELSKKCDCMIVIGGRKSSNTSKLYEICRNHATTIQVETAAELDKYNFKKSAEIGVIAGASTPLYIIEEVRRVMSDIIRETDEMSFEEMLENSIKNTYTGDRVTAVVTRILPNEIIVDLGAKQSGYIPLSELTVDPDAKPEDVVKVGDSIDLIVTRVNDVEGIITLSKKRVDAIAGFERVMSAAGTDEVFSGVVTDVVKGGVLAVTNGVKVFIPASHAALSKIDDLESMKRKEVQFKILEANRQRKRAVGSVRAVQRENRKLTESKFWDEIEIGKTYTGKVKSLTSYGAFVDLGPVDGMAHISELSWNRLRHPSEVVNVGDQVNVYVKDFNAKERKVSLGYKNQNDNPWERLLSEYPIGSVHTVKIVSVTTFGAFAQLLPGIDGLIHISEIANTRIEKPQDVLSVGQEVQVKITDIDMEKKRVSLSMRSLLEKSENAGVEASSQHAALDESAAASAAPETTGSSDDGSQ